MRVKGLDFDDGWGEVGKNKTISTKQNGVVGWIALGYDVDKEKIVLFSISFENAPSFKWLTNHFKDRKFSSRPEGMKEVDEYLERLSKLEAFE